jgi:hypothetical protein
MLPANLGRQLPVDIVRRKTARTARAYHRERSMLEAGFHIARQRMIARHQCSIAQRQGADYAEVSLLVPAFP